MFFDNNKPTILELNNKSVKTFSYLIISQLYISTSNNQKK
jgi:hypothetical protein